MPAAPIQQLRLVEHVWPKHVVKVVIVGAPQPTLKVCGLGGDGVPPLTVTLRFADPAAPAGTGTISWLAVADVAAAVAPPGKVTTLFPAVVLNPVPLTVMVLLPPADAQLGVKLRMASVVVAWRWMLVRFPEPS